MIVWVVYTTVGQHWTLAIINKNMGNYVFSSNNWPLGQTGGTQTSVNPALPTDHSSIYRFSDHLQAAYCPVVPTVCQASGKQRKVRSSQSVRTPSRQTWGNGTKLQPRDQNNQKKWTDWEWEMGWTENTSDGEAHSLIRCTNDNFNEQVSVIPSRGSSANFTHSQVTGCTRETSFVH